MELNVVQLYKRYAEKKRKQLQIFQKVLQKCEYYIKTVSSTSDKMKCVYLVPNFVPGLPMYNISECTSFIKKELEDAGFVVKYFIPNMLIISWDITDLEETPSVTDDSKKIDLIPQSKPEKSVKFLLNDNQNYNSSKKVGKFSLTM
jgi:hypothetical protein